MKKRITQDDYVKANRKASREAEIEMYGHPICHKRVFAIKGKGGEGVPFISNPTRNNRQKAALFFCLQNSVTILQT